MTPLTGVLVIVQSVLLFVVAQQLYQFRVTLPPYELYADRGMVRINAAVFKVSSWFGLTPTLVPPAAGGLMSPVNIAPELDCDTLFYRYNITCRSPVATEVPPSRLHVFQVAPPNGIYGLNVSTAGASDPQCVQFGATGSFDLGNATCTTGTWRRSYLQPRTVLVVSSWYLGDPPATTEWPSGLPLTGMSVSRDHFVVASTLRYMYVLGGSIAGTDVTTVERYDAIQDEWSLSPSMPRPHTDGHAVSLPGGALLVLGGTSNLDRQLIVDRFYKGVWKNVTVLPVGAENVIGAVMIGATCYVVAYANDTVTIFSYLQRVWTNVTTRRLPVQAVAIVVAAVLGRVYIFRIWGGLNHAPMHVLTDYFEPGVGWTNVSTRLVPGDNSSTTLKFSTVYAIVGGLTADTSSGSEAVTGGFEYNALTGEFVCCCLSGSPDFSGCIRNTYSTSAGIGHVALPVVPVRRTTTTTTTPTTARPSTTTTTRHADVILIVGGFAQGTGAILGEPAVDARILWYSVSDSDAFTYTLCAPMITKLGDFASTMFNGEFYVFGGDTVNGLAMTTAVSKYTPATNSWTEMPPLATPRVDAFAVVVPWPSPGETAIMLFGGFISHDAGYGNVWRDILVYDMTSTNRATILDYLPGGYVSLSSVTVLYDSVYVLGVDAISVTHLYVAIVVWGVGFAWEPIAVDANMDSTLDTTDIQGGLLVTFNGRVVYCYDLPLGGFAYRVYDPLTGEWSDLFSPEMGLFLLQPGFVAVRRTGIVYENSVIVMGGRMFPPGCFVRIRADLTSTSECNTGLASKITDNYGIATIPYFAI